MGKPHANVHAGSSSSKPAPSGSSDRSAPASSPSPTAPSKSTRLIDLDQEQGQDHDHGHPPPDEPLPSYEDSTSTPLPHSSTPASTDPPPFSIYEPVTHAHYLNAHLISHDPHLNTDGEALYRFLLAQNRIPPVQHVQVHGSHEVRNTTWERDSEGRSRSRTETRTVTDFRFRLDLTGGLWAIVNEVAGVAAEEGEWRSRGPLESGGELRVLDDEEKVYRGGCCKSRWAPKQRKQKRGCCGWKKGNRKGKNRSTPEIPPPAGSSSHDEMGRLLATPTDQDPEAGDSGGGVTTPTPDYDDIIPDSQLSIRAWADKYCHLPTTLKEFIVRKRITNLDKPLLSDLLTNTIRQTGYRGTISISYPKREHKIALYPDTTLARCRNNPWIRWFFYLTFLWILAWPILYLSTKKFHVVVSDWAWGWVREKTLVRVMDHRTGESRLVEEWGWKQGASEREWVALWAGAVRCAARGRREDDRCLIGEDRVQAERAEEGFTSAGREGGEGGGARLGAMAGLLGGMVGGVLGRGTGGGTRVCLRIGGGEDGWGADENW